MIIVEYRVPMPFSAQEYRIGQLYTIAKKSKLESADRKNGVRINANEPYSNGPEKGQYTNKTYYLSSKLPDWMKRLLPDSAAQLREEAWNAYPYSRNKFTNPMLEKLNLEIESRYLDGLPERDNVFNLEKNELNLRSVVVVDFVSEKYASKRNEHSAIAEQEILNFEPLFRGRLTRDWLRDHELAQDQSRISDDSGTGEYEKRLMTCYKLCRVSFPVWPLQGKVEHFIQQYCRDTIIESHRQSWLWQDEWTGMTLDDIRTMELETQDHLKKVMQE